EDGAVPHLIPALPGELHAQLPRRVGEISDHRGDDLQGLHLVVHVPMQALALGDLRHVVVVAQVLVQLDDGEALLTRRIAVKDRAADGLRLYGCGHEGLANGRVTGAGNGTDACPSHPRLPTYMGLPVTQGVLVAHPADHQQPAALICAADIWNTCRTWSRSIAV